MKNNNLQRLFLMFFLCLIGIISSWAGRYYTEDGIVYLLDEANSTAIVHSFEEGIKTADIRSNVCGCVVISIKGGAFEECKSLQSVTIPNSVTSIGNGAFLECKSLQSVTIPNSVTSIGTRAFRECRSLRSVTIPNSVTSIGGGTFYGCTSLQSVIIPNSVISIGEYAFNYCTSLQSVTIPNSVTSIESWAFEKCTSLQSVTIPNSVTSIGGETFYGCSSLRSVTIPNSVTSIGGGTFYGCSSLRSVAIPNSVTSIGEWMFCGCSSLRSVTIPNSVTSIGRYAFYGCTSLQPVTIPNSVTSIESWAFEKCTSLQSVTIPNSVTSIGGSAFSASLISTFIVPGSVNLQMNNGICPYLLQGTFDVLSKINLDSLRSLRLIGQGSNQTFETPNLSYIDVKCPLSSLSSFAGAKFLTVHLNEGIDYPSELLKGSDIELINIPADMHEWKFGMDMPDHQVTIYVETDSLYLTTPFREFDNIVCAHPGGTKVVANSDLLDYGGKWYGDFKGYIKEDNMIIENPIFETYDNALGLVDYELFCFEPAAIDLLVALDNTEYNRQLVYEALQSNIYPFHSLRMKSYSELQEKYNNINDALKAFGQTFYDQLQTLCNTYNKVKAETVYPYINADAKNTFESTLAEATAALAMQDVYKVYAAQQSLQTAYDSIIVVINRYNEALQTSKAVLKQLYATCNEVGKTTYTDIYPYIDDDTKSAFLATLNEAQTLFEDYDNDKVTAARTKLQTSYDAIVAEVKRYKESLQESKQQLLSLCSTCSKVGTSTYTDIYPYIDSTAKETLTAAIAKAQSDVVVQTNDMKEVQAAQTQLQTAYDKVMALISAYNETLANNQKAILQQIQTEGNLKSEAEYTSIDYAIRQAYEQAINNAKSVRYSKDVMVITNAMESLHQNYESVRNAINELTKDLISPKEALRDQLSHCHDYDADAAYFSGDDLREATSRAEAALNDYDVNYINDCTTTLRDVLSAIETEIATNKAKEQEVRQLFEDSYVVLSDISQYVSDIDKEQHDYITVFNLYDEYPQFKEISIGDSVYANSDQTFYRYASNVSDAQKALSKMNDNLNNVGYDNNQLKFYDNRDDADRNCLCTYDYAEILRDFIAWGRKSIDEINATQQNDSAWIIDKRDRIEAMMADECFSYLSDHVKWSLSEYWKRCYSYNWNKYAQRIYIILEFYNKKVNEDYTVAAIYLESVAPLRALISKARSLQADEYAELYASVDEEDRNSLNEAITQAQSCIEKADVENIPTVQATLQQVYYTIYGTMYVTLNQQCNEWVAKAEQLKVDYADVYELLSEEDALKLSNAVADVKNADNLENLFQAMQQLIAVYNEVSEKLDALRTTTAITNIKEFDSTTRIYDLKGRRVVVKDMRSLKPGVYIINGRKVMIK